MSQEQLKNLQDTNASIVVARDAYRASPSEGTWGRYQDAFETSAGAASDSEVCARSSEPPTVSELAEAADAASNAYINALAYYVRNPSSDNLVGVRNAMQADREAFRAHVVALKTEILKA